jgi:hypothetical protein
MKESSSSNSTALVNSYSDFPLSWTVASWRSPKRPFRAPMMSSCVVPANIFCRKSTVCPCRIANSCVSFARAAQPLWSATLSNLQWNTVHDVDPPNFPASPPLSLYDRQLRLQLPRVVSGSRRVASLRLVLSPVAHYWTCAKTLEPADGLLPWRLCNVSVISLNALRPAIMALISHFTFPWQTLMSVLNCF